VKFIGALLLCLGLLCAACQPKSELGAERQLDQLFSETHAAGKFDGNVLIMRDGKTLYQKSFGLANRAAATANTAATRFPLASVSKPFTAVLILQLYEQGTLKLTDRLDGIFPAMVGKPAAAVTVEQLLTHTSGIEEITERHLIARLSPVDLEDAQITGTPGTYKYSNSGYVILKMIAERLTATDYETLLKEKILDRAGMTATGLVRKEISVTPMALAYADNKATSPVSPAVLLDIFDGAGSIYSTTGDLQRFDEALNANRLLSAQSQALMYKNHTASGTPWGYGWALGEQGGKLFPYHSGDYAGYHTALVRQTQRKELIVILSNLETADVSALRHKALRILKTSWN
jgi:CubicO group peptidase (beta-lactamase class C family)